MACLCCWPLPQEKDNEPLIVDINQVLADEVWTYFTCSLGYLHRKYIKRSNYRIDIPENFFLFDPVGNQDYRPIDPTLGSGTDETQPALHKKVENHHEQDSVINSPSETGHDDNVKVAKHVNGGVDTEESVSLDTTFTNDTAEKQTYQFKFCKARTSKIDVTYQTGFTLGGKANFTLGLPKTLASASLGLAVERRYEVKESQGQTFEESVMMEATSDIAVAQNSKYVAKVQLKDRRIHATFTVRIRMSMPKERAPIYVRRRSDDVEVFVFHVKNLESIFFKAGRQLPYVQKVRENGKAVPTKVDFLVEGVIRGNLACDHSINLTSYGTDDQKIMPKN